VTPPFADQAVLIIPTDEDVSMDVVRAWVHTALDGMGLLPRLRVALVVEELVSNARRHGHLPGVLRLSVDHEYQVLLVYVDDCAGDDGLVWPCRAGLALVDALSLDWGVEPRPRGKTVWAELALGVGR
jgi:hypothetical protein